MAVMAEEEWHIKVARKGDVRRVVSVVGNEVPKLVLNDDGNRSITDDELRLAFPKLSFQL